MKNIITNLVVRDRCVESKPIVSIRQAKVFISIQHFIGSDVAVNDVINSIKKVVRDKVLEAAERPIEKARAVGAKCASVSIEYGTEDPELNVEIWDPIKFNANFDSNFSKLIFVADDMARAAVQDNDRPSALPEV